MRRKQLAGLGEGTDDRLRFSLVTTAARAPVEQEPERVVGAAGQPGFAGTWGSAGAGYGLPRFWQTDNLWTHFAGQAASGSSGSTIFTLPNGYAPPFEQHEEIFTLAGYGYIRIIAAGRFGAGEVIATGLGLGYVPLDGIKFRAV